MRTSIFSILLALTLVIAAPLAFSAEDQVAEQGVVETETVVEEVESVDKPEVAESETKEYCTNNADDDGDSKVDCDDADCADDPGCKGGY